MNLFLWILQVLLAALFLMAGAGKLFMFDKLAQSVESTGALSRGAWMGVGVFELFCALALVIPAATGRLPVLTPVAAACLALEGILVAGLHYAYSEYSPLMFNLGLAVLAAFISYGRFVLRPLEIPE